MTGRFPVRRGRPLAVVTVIVVAVAAIIGTAVLVRPSPPPTTGRVPAPPAQALLVSIGHTGSNVVNRGYPTSLTVRALGERPIASVELWLGARRLGSATNEGGAAAQVARWNWAPADAGPAILVARATDDRGREAQSGPLRLTVLDEPPIYRKVSQVATLEGETATAAAARVGGSADDLATWNEDLDAYEPLPAGSVVFVPFDPQPMPRVPTAELVDLTASDYGLRAPSAILPGTARLASWQGAGSVTGLDLAEGAGLFVPPEVDASVSECTVQLRVASGAANATGLGVYGLGPTSTSFARVATLAPSGSGATYETEASAGTYLFTVSTYDGAREEQGDLVEVEVPPECGEPGWSGRATLSDGLLLVEGDVDRAYLYLSQDGRPWIRVPSEAGTFVERVDGRLDFTDVLPQDVDTSAVDLEAWGWKGGSLLDLGTGHRDAAPTPPPAAGSAPPPVGGGGGAGTVSSFDFTALDWVTSKPVSGSPEISKEPLYLREGELVVWTKSGTVVEDLTRYFRWQSNAASVDSVVWQVAAFPMSPDLAPSHPGVLLQKTMPVAEGTKTGEFDIDFRQIFAPAKEAKIGDVLGADVVGQISLAGLGGIGATPVPSATAGPFGTPASGSAAGEVAAASWLLQSFTPSVLYVRAVAMDGFTVAGPVSNFVKFTVTADSFTFDPNAPIPTGPQPTNGPSAGLRPYVLFMEFVPPANVNPAFANCVMVTGIDAQKGGLLYGLETGDFYCYVAPNSGGGWSLAEAFDDFVDFVADAWDQIANAWSWLQQQLASAVAKYSGCSAIAGGDFCESMAQVGISVALASVGIPPSLPNTEDLMQLAKGELKDALVDVASKSVKAVLGYDPCDAAYLASKGLGTASCEEIAAKLIDDLAGQLDAWKTQEATATTGAQLLQGVDVVVHPWGQIRPPKFRVTIARNVNVPLPTAGACTMRLSMTSYRPDWTHSAYIEGKGWTTVTEDVSGQPFASLYLQIPDPTSSEGSFEIPQALPKDASIYQAIFAAMNQKVALTRDYYLTETNFWREPNNPTVIYKSGQGYVYTVDQGNRAWVLLFNGTIVKAGIGPGPTVNCFDGITAYAGIPLQDLGYPCTPAYGVYWQTKDAPFAGPPEQVAKCEADYQKVAAW